MASLTPPPPTHRPTHHPTHSLAPQCTRWSQGATSTRRTAYPQTHPRAWRVPTEYPGLSTRDPRSDTIALQRTGCGAGVVQAALSPDAVLFFPLFFGCFFHPCEPLPAALPRCQVARPAPSAGSSSKHPEKAGAAAAPAASASSAAKSSGATARLRQGSTNPRTRAHPAKHSSPCC